MTVSEWTLIKWENVIKLFIRGKVCFLGNSDLTIAGIILAYNQLLCSLQMYRDGRVAWRSVIISSCDNIGINKHVCDVFRVLEPWPFRRWDLRWGGRGWHFVKMPVALSLSFMFSLLWCRGPLRQKGVYQQESSVFKHVILTELPFFSNWDIGTTIHFIWAWNPHEIVSKILMSKQSSFFLHD